QDTEDFRAWMHREFPSNADLLEGDDRRQFIKVMGASFALAGLGAAACRRIPEQKIVPNAARPQERIPVKPVEYASSLERGGVGLGVLVKSYDARPVKLEGNPDHPTTMGSCDPMTQSEVLRVYDPHRSRTVLKDGRPSSAAAFETWMSDHAGKLGRNAFGTGSIAVLSEASGSPSLIRMRQEFAKKFPQMQWHEWEPIDGDAGRAGTKLAFGAPHTAQPMLDRAEVVVCLDADPLNGGPTSTRLARDWATRRRLEASDPSGQTLSRVYAVEGVFSVTGMNADDRLPVRPSDVVAVAAAIAQGVEAGIDGVDQLASSLALEGVDAEILAAMIEDLRSNRGSSVVLAGEGQPPAVHALAAAINVALGNVGKTIAYTADPAPMRTASIRSLVEQLDGQGVDTLLIIGGNPVYDAPADLDFATAMGKAGHVIHLAFEVNETSRAAEWHLPRTHFLESWGDTTAHDGTIAITQPLIEPMLPLDQKGWSPIEFLAAVAGHEPGDGYSIVRATEALRSKTSGATFEAQWRTILDAGLIAGTASPTVAPTRVDAGRVAGAVKMAADALATRGDGMDFQFLPDSTVYDGRFAGVGWLQELPDAITKITWDNALLVGPGYCIERKLSEGDMVSVTLDGRTIEAAVFPVPGMAPNTAAMAIGWGRGEAAGPIGAGAGFDAYPLRTVANPWIGTGASVVPTGGAAYAFAQTQDHGAADALNPEVPAAGIQERLPTLVRETTLDDYKSHPDFAQHRVHVAHRLSLWEETNLDGAKFRWALSVDLNTCTGCGACVTACQAENNIPVVGKDQIARGREMHWLRIDRYFKGMDPTRPEGVFVQPVTCMQCENAPCEQVCPVAATVHNEDGLNVMVYNRCIGTRYCSNNCPYKVRRFNWFDYWRREPIREQEGLFAVKPDYYTSGGPDEWRRMQFNPEVTVRTRGVMEKCSFCVQRINEAKIAYKNEWARAGGTATSPDWSIPDGVIKTACQQACSTDAIVFGDLNDPKSEVSRLFAKPVSYQLLEELNTKPRVRYVARVTNPAVPLGKSDGHHGDHGHGHDHDDGHAAAATPVAEGVRA
ncbi:MAG: Fe-S-cluster-containing hydrogenase, partial [Planctomycetota bacterium]|nr:Fe-S-cluster-containing hydrogenase [Planctomycetota bacterium]